MDLQDVIRMAQQGNLEGLKRMSKDDKRTFLGQIVSIPQFGHKDPEILTPLMAAVKEDRKEVVTWIIKAIRETFPDNPQIIDVKGNTFCTPGLGNVPIFDSTNMIYHIFVIIRLGS